MRSFTCCVSKFLSQQQQWPHWHRLNRRFAHSHTIGMPRRTGTVGTESLWFVCAAPAIIIHARTAHSVLPDAPHHAKVISPKCNCIWSIVSRAGDATARGRIVCKCTPVCVHRLGKAIKSAPERAPGGTAWSAAYSLITFAIISRTLCHAVPRQVLRLIGTRIA